MLDHLGIQDAVEISIEQGRIILTAPETDAKPKSRKITLEEAINKGIAKYRPALEVLAGIRDANDVGPDEV